MDARDKKRVLGWLRKKIRWPNIEVQIPRIETLARLLALRGRKGIAIFGRGGFFINENKEAEVLLLYGGKRLTKKELRVLFIMVDEINGINAVIRGTDLLVVTEVNAIWRRISARRDVGATRQT
jgi:hypothetical protein